MNNAIYTILKEELPPLLKETPRPPKKLFARGCFPPSHHTLLSVVGSRKMTRYGKECCEYLIAGMRGLPLTIVSGLALGIDGVAHRSALAAGLPTIAIPGSGLDESVLYPRAHLSLAKDILEAGGMLLSEEEPLHRARPENFPKRNRIMAGISHAVLIIEATEKSGTLITAKFAADYNREVLAVSHSIFSETGAGGHLFVKIGATPVRTTEDILDALSIEKREEGVTERELSYEEGVVYALLSEPKSKDEIIRSLSMGAGPTHALLLKMELEGVITDEGGMIRRVRTHQSRNKKE